jgi:hypothetical protein
MTPVVCGYRRGGLERTIATLERMERHAPSGQFYNWTACSARAATT